jgi:hypothetical protein
MLVKLMRNSAARRPTDDSGAVLLAVVITMFVGFVIAGTVAASVMFAVTSNSQNKDRTQAFIAAESGRDAARAAVQAAIDPVTGFDCDELALSAEDVPLGPDGVTYSYWIFPGVDAESADHESDTPACPDGAPAVIIHAEGDVEGKASSKLDAVYPLVPGNDPTTGGTLAYFGGAVAGQKSVYDGDLVVRTGTYTCPLDAVITGDLWVTRGAVSLSKSCHIQGSIYAFGEVASTSQDVKVDGDIFSNLGITLANNGTVVGGDIHAGTRVDLGGNGGTNGIVGGLVKAGDEGVDAVTVSGGWTVPDANRIPDAGQPDFEPELDDVLGMTSWIDLGRDGWAPTERIETGCPTDPTSLLPGSGTLLIDYSGCGAGSVTISIGDVAVDRDVVFLVPPAKTMKVIIDGDVTYGGSVDSAPQLMFVHEDRDQTLQNDEPSPTCESTGPDDLTTSNGIEAPQARLMVYTPCRLAGTVRVDFSGQFYVGSAFRGDDGDQSAKSVNFNNGAKINCKEMSWAPLLEQISCYITVDDTGGEAGGVPILGELSFQTEVTHAGA